MPNPFSGDRAEYATCPPGRVRKRIEVSGSQEHMECSVSGSGPTPLAEPGRWASGGGSEIRAPAFSRAGSGGDGRLANEDAGPRGSALRGCGREIGDAAVVMGWARLSSAKQGRRGGDEVRGAVQPNRRAAVPARVGTMSRGVRAEGTPPSSGRRTSTGTWRRSVSGEVDPLAPMAGPPALGEGMTTAARRLRGAG